MKNFPAIINATLAIGSTATAPYYDINITQQLCQSVCTDDTPVFAPQFSLKSIDNVGTNKYMATIHVEGAINYTPCGCGCCATRTQVLSQDFNIPIYNAAAITSITITVGEAFNTMAKQPCQTCSRTFVSSIPLTLNITA